MPSQLVFHAKESHIWRIKIVVLSEQLRRRYRNVDEKHSLGEKKEVIRRFLNKIMDSGYDLSTREEVIKSVTKKRPRDQRSRQVSLQE